jgi:hypothetical protein
MRHAGTRATTLDPATHAVRFVTSIPATEPA